MAPDGLRGVTRYDAQLLSPPLAIRAEDYPLMLVLLTTDRTGPGETFFGAPGQALSDDRQGRHVIAAGTGQKLYRTDLRRAKGPWAGPIERLRFDPLNLAGATLTISLIALCPDPGAMLVNGDVEILRDGKPFQWTAAGHPGRAIVTDEGAASGRRALRLLPKGSWETEAVDLSFLGTFRAAGKVRGTGCVLQVLFSGAEGPMNESRQCALTGGGDWTPSRPSSRSPTGPSTWSPASANRAPARRISMPSVWTRCDAATSSSRPLPSPPGARPGSGTLT